MQKIGIYDDGYEKRTRECCPLVKTDIGNRITNVRKELSFEVYKASCDNHVFCYISDLHLNYKIIKSFKEVFNEYEVERYLEKIVDKIKLSLPFFTDFVIFVGDVSCDFEIFKKFFTLYNKKIGGKIIFVMGNHELWDKNLIYNKSIDEIVEQYRTFLYSLNSSYILLENEIYFPVCKKTYNANMILNMSKERIRNIFCYNGFAVLGGLGFAGKNHEFNVEHGLYRTAPIDREEEKIRSEKISLLHDKLKECVDNKKIIVATHMPKSDWSDNDYVPNWIYLHGHTHNNYFIKNKNCEIYADNQIGYWGTSLGVKYFTFHSIFNPFEYYPDGIYKINKQDYFLFNFGRDIRIKLNREFYELIMIKRKECYCFFCRLKENGDLKFLSGGRIYNITHKDLNYYYDKMLNYVDSIILYLKSYSSSQKDISKHIKTIGGYGTIHGCIIDIDYYNHIYLNPFDGKIVPYHAKSMTHKYVYCSVGELLQKECPNLYLTYQKNITKGIIKASMNADQSPKFYGGTDIYKISKVLKFLQYTEKYNVVRIWNDEVCAKASSKNGLQILKYILDTQDDDKT